MRVRPARVDDRQDIGILLAALGYPIEGCLLGPAWQRLVEDPANCIRVADGGHRSIGLVTAQFAVVLHHGGVVGTIQSLVVDAERRGAGVGSLLVREVLDEARRRNARRVELAAAAPSSFYERLGFTPIGVKYASVL